MRGEADILAQVVGWAEPNETVRAAVMTSSRTQPGREADFLSDYDIEVFVANLEPFASDDEWLRPFGPIMVRWPRRPRATCHEDGITRLVHFTDGARIDFQILPVGSLKPEAYDDGYRVLIDKDGLTSALGEPTYTMYHVRKPTREEYEEVVHDFWWDATYVPKCLWRDELPFATHMHGTWLREKFLNAVIEWHIGLNHDWAVNPGVHGRWFKRYLDAETWADYEATFASADLEDRWRAFFALVALMRRLAKEVGEALGYPYPEEMDRELVDYFARVQFTPCPER